ICREAILLNKALSPCRRQLSHDGTDSVYPGVIDDYRNEVWLGEVSIVRSFLLAPLHDGYALSIIPSRGCLGHLAKHFAGSLEFLELPFGFVVHRSLDGAEAVEVLDLDNWSRHHFAATRHTDIDIGVHAQTAFLHFAVRHLQLAQEQSHFFQVGLRFLS